jgi:acyl-CoA reductase-like NAD-dependent aldehyde dehydrogenase
MFYDDLVRKAPRRATPKLDEMPKKKQEAFDQMLEAIAALQRENKELYGSLVKDTMKRKQPQFNEEYHGYPSFSRLLEDAERRGLVQLRRDPRSGTYVIEEPSGGE